MASRNPTESQQDLVDNRSKEEQPSAKLLPEKRAAYQQDGVTGRLALSMFAAVWGSVVFGWNSGVINNPKNVIAKFINATQQERVGVGFDAYVLDNIWSWLVVSIFALAGMIGGLLAGVLAEKLGRKRGMLVNAIFGVVGGACMGLSKPAGSFELIFIGRFLVGLCSGLYTGLVPLYLSETAPQAVRGAAGVMHQLGVVSGILVSQVLGLEVVFGTDNLWPVLMAMAALPCLLQLLSMPFCPESPRYLLITKGEKEEARKALVILRGYTDVDAELEALLVEQEQNKREPSVPVRQLFTSSALRAPLVIGIVMHLSQQLSGIGVIFYYSNTLFLDVGLSASASGYATLGVGGIMVVMTLVTVPLMDRAGRRPLHLVGLMGILVCSVGFTILFSLQPQVQWFAYPSVVLALSVVIFFALGPGSIPWMIMPELFGQGARSKAVSIGVAINWIANFLVGALFPVLQSGLNRLLFIPFIVITLACFIFIYFKLPETKNKSIEDIVAVFAKNPSYGSVGNDSSLGRGPAGHENQLQDLSIDQTERL